MRRAYTAAGAEDDVDADIELRASCKDRKLFLDDDCPVCCALFESEFAVFQCGHVVCGACAAKLPRVSRVVACPMCRRPCPCEINVHVVDDANFKRAMRSAGTMLPVRATESGAADADAQGAQNVRYGKAVSEDGLEGMFVEIQLVPAAHSRIRRTVVVVDVSGSMSPVIDTIDLGPLVASLVGTWLCVVTFGTSVDTIFEGVVKPGDVAPKLVSDGTTNLHGALDHVRRKIEAVEAIEAAQAADAVEAVCDVMIVTDGEPDDAELAVLAMRALKETGRASVHLVGTGPSYNFANCSKLLDNRTEEFEHVPPERVIGALTRGASVRVRVAGSPCSRMYLNGTVTAPVDGEHCFFASAAAHVVFTGPIDLGSMLVDGNRVSAKHDASLGYRVRGALLSMTAIARVKKACFELDAPAVARMHTLRDTEREIAQDGEFPDIVAMVAEGRLAVERGAERIQSTAMADSATAIARACTM